MTITTEIINVPCGHIAGLPIEESLASAGPALLLVGGAGLIALRVRVRRVRSRLTQPRRGRSEESTVAEDGSASRLETEASS